MDRELLGSIFRLDLINIGLVVVIKEGGVKDNIVIRT